MPRRGAMAGMFAKAQMQIFGDPSTMASMSQQFMKAAGYGNTADGLLATLPAEAKTLLSSLGQTVVSQMSNKPGMEVEKAVAVGTNGSRLSPEEEASGLISCEGAQGSDPWAFLFFEGSRL